MLLFRLLLQDITVAPEFPTTHVCLLLPAQQTDLITKIPIPNFNSDFNYDPDSDSVGTSEVARLGT